MPAVAEPSWQIAAAVSVAALRRVAAYTLPPALSDRVLELGERKDTLSPAERDELLAWVSFTQERSIEKHAAELALRQLAEIPPVAHASGSPTPSMPPAYTVPPASGN